MDQLKKILDQLKMWWADATIPTRVLFSGTAVLCVGIVGGIAVWSSRPNYVDLATGLSPTAAAEAVSKLEAKGIESRLNYAGSSIQVPRKKIAEARMAVGDSIDPMHLAKEKPMGWLEDPRRVQDQMTRDKEWRIAQTVMQMSGVQSARVHIAEGEDSLFIADRRPVTASVVLELKPNVFAPRDLAEAVARTVTQSVDGLMYENVTVVDTMNNILTGGSMPSREKDQQVEYRRRLEAELEQKAQAMLNASLGVGRSIARVTLDIDHTRKDTTTLTYEKKPIKVTEKSTTTKNLEEENKRQGVAGTNPNIKASTPSLFPVSKSDSTEVLETTYLPNEKKDVFVDAPGEIKKMSVAVYVDLSPREGEEESAVDPQLTKDLIESSIKSAVGFDVKRNDQLAVVVTKLPGLLPLGNPFAGETETWDFYKELIRNGSLGLGALVALLLGMLILRKMRPIAVGDEEAAEIAADRAKMLAVLYRQAKEDPEAISKVFTQWMGDESAEGAVESAPQRAAA